MSQFTFYVCNVNDPANPKRIQRGDIVNVLPYPRAFGKRPLEDCTIILVDVPDALAPEDVMRKFRQQYFEGGVNEWEIEELNLGIYDEHGFPVLNPKTGEPVDAGDTADIAVKNSGIYNDPIKWRGGYRERPAMLSKARYRMPLDNLKAEHLAELDDKKVDASEKVYQPCLTVAKIQESTLNHPQAPEAKDIDCGLLPDKETIITWDEAKALIQDKYDGKYYSPTGNQILTTISP